MAEIDLNRQLHTRLIGLQAAGVDWLPNVPPLELAAPVAAEQAPAAVADVHSLDHRRQALTVLAERVSRCDRCPELAATRSQTVFGVGPAGAEICFIGEAPGADEDRQGEPFVGAAGQLLNKIIMASGLRRDEIYICNILRCRPPGNRQPTPDEAGNCREYLDATLDLVQPKVIVCWGGVAATNLLTTTTGITRLRGKWTEYRGWPVICTFHPASLLPGRSPENKKYVWEDMKSVLRKVGRPVPGE